MAYLVLLRHGQSIWNKRLRFTGWADVPLSTKGRTQIITAARWMQTRGVTFDVCFTSWLERAAESAAIVLETMGLHSVDIETSWRLNERHYGGLQGLGLAGALLRYGLKTVRASKREFTALPPVLDISDPRFPGNDPRYETIPLKFLPRAESMEQALARLMPYWNDRIVPAIRLQKGVLIVSHGNILRALVKFLDGTSAADVAKYSIRTGEPLIYEMDETAKAVARYHRSRRE